MNKNKRNGGSPATIETPITDQPSADQPVDLTPIKADRLSASARAEINALIPTLQAETLAGNATEKNRNYLGRDYMIRLCEAIDPRFTIGDLKPTDRGFRRYTLDTPDGQIRHTIWTGKDEKAGK